MKPAGSRAGAAATPGWAPACFRWTLAGTGAWFGLLYAVALWRLAGTAGEMENKFSKLALERYLGFLVWQNVRVLGAYLLLAAAAAVAVWPAVAWWLGRSRRPGRLAAAWRGLLLAALAHGYFTLRLVESRPYFVSADYYGHWFYRVLGAPPEPLRGLLAGLLFGVLPWLAGGAAAGWYALRGWRAGRLGRAVVVAAAAVVVAVAGGVRWFDGGRAAAVGAVADSAPNILVLASDSLRGDRLGYAGYRPARGDGAAAAGVSPAIDGLAGRSVVFENCFTPLASTIESTTSLMAAEYPHTHGLRQMYPGREELARTAGRVVPLAARLREAGYDTAAIGDWCAAVYEVLPLGFEHVEVSSFDNFRVYMTQAVLLEHKVVPLYLDNRLGYRLFPEIRSFAEFVTPQVVTERVVRRLGERARDRRPFFWHVFYSCNHLPYRSPEPFCTMFSDPGYGGGNRGGVAFDIDEFIGGTDLEEKWRALPEPEVRQVRALYDGCTRMFDACVGEILAALRRHGLDRRTIVVVTSDHGDDLYEPGATLGHGLGFIGGDQANHVPLVMHIPGTEARRIGQTVRVIDIAPTLAELAGVGRPPEWEGRSLAGWLRGGEGPESRPVYAETGFPFIQFRVAGVERPPLPPMDEMTFIDESFNHQFVLRPEFAQRLVAAKERCLRTARWKLVCTPTATGGRHFRLFHLPDDPHCQHDLSERRPEVCGRMRGALEAWIDEHRETPLAEIFPGGEPDGGVPAAARAPER